MLHKEVCLKCKEEHYKQTRKKNDDNIWKLMVGVDVAFDSPQWNFYCHVAKDYLDQNTSQPPRDCTYILEQTIYNNGENNNGSCKKFK